MAFIVTLVLILGAVSALEVEMQVRDKELQ